MYLPPLRRCVSTVLLLLAAGSACAIDPRLPLAALHHTMWTARDGMPGDVWDMTQDRAGFLWFAATSGLYRFDGARFERVQAFGGQPLLSNVMSVAHAFDDGSLWLGYRYAGIGVVRGGVLRHFTEADGYVPGLLRAIERDGRGRIWAAAGPRVLRYDGSRWQVIGPEHGLPGPTDNLGIDGAGRVWVGAGDALYRLDPGRERFVRSATAPGYTKAIDAPDGSRWLHGAGRLLRVGAPDASRAAQAFARLPYAWDAVFDRDGNLWDTGSDGMRRIPATELAGRGALRVAGPGRDFLPMARLTGSPVIAMADREDDLWVATRNGVDRFRRDRIATLGLPPGYSYIGLALDADDGVWVRAVDTQVPGLWRRDGAGLHLQPERDVTFLATAADGALLLARAGALERRLHGARTRIPYPAGLEASTVTTLVDAGGSLWAGFVPGGLRRWRDGRWQAAADFGLPANAPLCSARDGAGALWLGYRDDRVAVLDARSGAVTRYGRADGLDVGVVGQVADVGGARLVAGDMGLAVLTAHGFVRVALADPQALAGITGMLATPGGDVWLNGGRGLVRIPAAAWRAWLADPRGPVGAYALFDDVDGYPGIAQFGVGEASLRQDRTGRIWLAGSSGAGSIDPQQQRRNALAPPVHIMGASAAGHAYVPGAGVALPAGTRDLQLTYTAPSFAMPERVRFRYRLEGADSGWQDAGARRVAYYNNLRPGRYRFAVTAANEDGVWNAQPATLAVTIAPTFVQDWPFKLLCASAAALAAWLLVRLRLRRATGRLRRLLQVRASERERIARTLHDTLMQSVQALLMLFERARDQLPPDSAARPLLDRTLGQARATLREGRDEVSALRGAAAPERDLVGALLPLGHLLGSQFGVRFEADVRGPRRALCRDVAVEACFIAREALQNAFRHAHATAVVLEVEFGSTGFVLRVRDDGRGLAPDAVRPGHWGLAGMRERAAGIGARLLIGPGADGRGATVELRVAAADAYDGGAPSRWWRRRRRRADLLEEPLS